MSQCDDFRELVCRLARHLREHDVKELEYMYRLPQQRGTNPSLETLRQLERMGEFSRSSPEGLKGVLEKIERKDLIEWVERYIKAQQKITTPQVRKLVCELGTSCWKVDNKAKALATLVKREIDTLLRKEKTSGEGATATKLLPLLKLAEDLRSSSADCVQQCSVLESATRRSTSCVPPPRTGTP